MDDSPLGLRTPVVLIHGWNADESTWNAFCGLAAKHPLAARRCKLYRFGYDWSRAVASSAELLRGDLASNPELLGRPLILVGHSMGGLVARTWLESDADALNRVGLLITLGTPHHGSPAADLSWLTGGSSYTLLAKLIPLGLLEFLDRVPIIHASRTEGGHDLGWDNYDSSMPPTIWAGSSHFLADLNRRLANHPLRDELLRRYRFHAGYLGSVPSLNVLQLERLIRAGDYYAAGAALLSQAFRDPSGQPIQRWWASDGIVPLDSALFLQPGKPLTGGGRSVKVDLAAVQERRRPLAALGGVHEGLDHSELTSDPAVAQQVLDTVAGAEFAGLAVTAAGRLSVYTPGQGAPVPVEVAEDASQALAALAGDLLVVRRGDALQLLRPEGVRTAARAAGDGGWLLSPDGRRAVGPDGAVVGVTASAYRRLTPAGTAVSHVLWSPDGEHLAYGDADGRLSLLDLRTLLTQPVGEPSGAPVRGELRPLAWTPDSRYLLAARGPGVLEAAFHPDSGRAALVVDPAVTAQADSFDTDGVRRGTWTVPPAAVAGPRLVVMLNRQDVVTPVASAARAPVWARDGSWLAWVSGDGAVGLRRNTEARTVVMPAGTVADLRATAGGRALVTVATAARGTALLAIAPDAREATTVAGAPAAPAGATVLSPDGRYAAVPLADGTTLVARLDATWQQVVTGKAPVWLPAPAARRWAPEARA